MSRGRDQGRDQDAVPPGPVRAVGTFGRAWRAAVLVGIVAAAAYGTLRGTDDLWPAAPMSQFAFSVREDGDIPSNYVDAVTVDGRTVRVPLTSNGVGLARAEIEGQLTRIVARPALLGSISVAWHRRHPEAPPLSLIRLRQTVYHLRAGTVVGQEERILARYVPRDGRGR